MVIDNRGGVIMKIDLKFILIIGVIVIGTVVFMFYSQLGNNSVSNENFEQALEDRKLAESLVQVRSLAEIKKDMHHMTHEVIIADQKWGRKPLTEENINMLILELELLEPEEVRDQSIKNKLIEILYKWKDGDLSTADEDHNYIWKLQGGTIGKATGVNHSAIPTWAVERRREVQAIKQAETDEDNESDDQP